MGTYSYTGAAQFVTIDVKGTYDITADGAAGGGTSSGATEPSGKGAEIGGDFKLAKGEKLEIQAGADAMAIKARVESAGGIEGYGKVMAADTMRRWNGQTPQTVLGGSSPIPFLQLH